MSLPTAYNIPQGGGVSNSQFGGSIMNTQNSFNPHSSILGGLNSNAKHGASKSKLSSNDMKASY